MPNTMFADEFVAAIINGGLASAMSQLPPDQQLVMSNRLRELISDYVYWGTSNEESLDSDGVLGLEERSLATRHTGRYLRGGAEGAQPAAYIYFAYPVAMGGYFAAMVRNPATANPVSLEFVSSVVMVENEAGSTTPYFVLRSPAKLTGSVMFNLLTMS
jgi:hypothetical protein